VKPSIRLDAMEIGREAGKEIGRKLGVIEERKRIIALLIELDAIRRCAATGELCCFDTYGEKVIYLPGLEHNERTN